MIRLFIGSLHKSEPLSSCYLSDLTTEQIIRLLKFSNWANHFASLSDMKTVLDKEL